MKQEVELISSFIRVTFVQSHKSTAVIALSGGIDSAASFVLTVIALGSQHVHAFYLPSKTSNPLHLQHCHELTSSFNLPTSNFHIIPIASIIQKSWRIIKKNTFDKSEILSAQPCLADRRADAFRHATCLPAGRALQNSDLSKLRLANLSARIRMTIIFDQAKKFDALVVGTENRSEHLLGYFTRFGDEASDIEPIRHLFKTQVIELAHTLNIPQPIIDKPPTADLWP